MDDKRSVLAEEPQDTTEHPHTKLNIVKPERRMGFLPNFSLSGPQNNKPTEKNKKNRLSVMLTIAWVVSSASTICGSTGRYSTVERGGKALIRARKASAPFLWGMDGF